MNILDLHVNCHVALHPKQFENLDCSQRYGYRSSSSIRENLMYNSNISNMDYEESAFKYQPYKRSTNDLETSSMNYQNSSFYNVYDKWHYYSVSPSERYGTSEHHNSILPLGHSSYPEQSGTNSYMDLGCRRYASDLYGQVYDQQLPDTGFYPYTPNLNSYFNLHDNNHQSSGAYYPQRSRYQIPQNGYQNLYDTEISSISERKPDASGRWYVVPTGRSAGLPPSQTNSIDYESTDGFTSGINSGQKMSNYTDKSEKTSDSDQKLASQYGKSSRQSGNGKCPSNFTLHVRKQERKLKKRLKELQSKNCEKATQLQEYYHYKVIMVEKQAQQRHQSDSVMSCIESSEETDVQILQLIHEMEERVNALQFSMNEEMTDKFVCGEVRKTRLLPKHAIKTLETWYEENLSNPYPSRDQTVRLALDCTLTIEQVRKWFANKRNRSRNNKLHLLK